MVKLTKEEFRNEMDSFLRAINVDGRIVNLNPTNDQIDHFFEKYYNQVPKMNVYKEGIETMVEDALDDAVPITFKDIIDKWDEADDRTTIASVNTTDSIEDYLGGKRKCRRYKRNKTIKSFNTKKRRYNKQRRTNKKRSIKRKTHKRKRHFKGGKGMTDTISEEPIVYKEDEYDQMKNDLNY